MEIKTVNLGPVSNSYVVTENGKSMLIDTGCYLNQPGWACTMVMSGVMPNTVSLVALTHGHFDHAAGMHHAKVVTGAPVLAHPGAQTFLSTGEFPAYVGRNEMGNNFIANVAGPAPLDVPEEVKIDIEATDGMSLAEYGFSGKVLFTPGHTTDSVSYVFEDGSAFVGDTILDPFGQGICTGAVICPDRDALIASFEKLLATNATTFYSGHGGPFTREQVEGAYKALVETND